MVDRWKVENGASYSLFVTEPEADAFIAAQAVPWDRTKSFVSVEETIDPIFANVLYEEGRKLNDLTTVPNDGAFETDLASYTIPWEMLFNSWDSVRLEAFWEFWGNINPKTLKVYFGSETVYDSWAQIQSGGKWAVVLDIYTLSLTTQKVLATVRYSSDVTLFVDEISSTETSEDATVDILARVTGEGIDPDDLVSEGVIATYIKWVS